MLKKINDILAGIPATVIAGMFLLLDLVPHLMEEFGGTAVPLNLLSFDPAWITVIISGIPLVYLAIWRVIYNPGISKISSALLITIAMIAAIAIGDLFAAGEVAWIRESHCSSWYNRQLLRSYGHPLSRSGRRIASCTLGSGFPPGPYVAEDDAWVDVTFLLRTAMFRRSVCTTASRCLNSRHISWLQNSFLFSSPALLPLDGSGRPVLSCS